MLIGGLLILVRRFPLPVRLFEFGASAGLNLRADRFRYRSTGGQCGPETSAVLIDDAWRGRYPPDVDLRIGERHGVDVAPVDVGTDDGRLTLLSYVWPDMPVRLQRLDGAIQIARAVPAVLERRSAGEAVGALRLAPDTISVLWHSVTWQYLDAAEQARITADVDTLGATADLTAPLVWLNFEPQPRSRRRRRIPGAGPLRAGCHRRDPRRRRAHGPPVIWA